MKHPKTRPDNLVDARLMIQALGGPGGKGVSPSYSLTELLTKSPIGQPFGSGKNPIYYHFIAILVVKSQENKQVKLVLSQSLIVFS